MRGREGLREKKKVYTIVIKKRKKKYFARMWNQAEISIKRDSLRLSEKHVVL